MKPPSKSWKDGNPNFVNPTTRIIAISINTKNPICLGIVATSTSSSSMSASIESPILCKRHLGE